MKRMGRPRVPMGAVVDFQDCNFGLGCWFLGLSSASRKPSALYIGLHLITYYLHLHKTPIILTTLESSRNIFIASHMSNSAHTRIFRKAREVYSLLLLLASSSMRRLLSIFFV